MLNRSEREALISIAVSAKYGQGATLESARVADHIVRLFPAIESDYRVSSNIQSSELLSAEIRAVLCYHIGADQCNPFIKQAKVLLDSKEEIADAFYDWCNSVGVTPAALSDSRVYCRLLCRVQSLKDFMASRSVDVPELALFAEMLPGGEVNLMSLIT